MSEWYIDNVTVREVNFMDGINAFEVYFADSLYGTVYPKDKAEFDRYTEALDDGANPYTEAWEMALV